MNWDTADMTQLQVPDAGDIASLQYKDTRPENKERWSWRAGRAEPWDEAIEPIAYIG